MKKGDIVRMARTPKELRDRPGAVLPIHAVVVEHHPRTLIERNRVALWVYEHNDKGHTCAGLVPEPKHGWWANEEDLELIEEV